MSDMVRKQIYIRKQQDEILKRLSGARGVSEAEIVREAIDREIAGSGKRPLTHDWSAWDEILRFLESRQSEEMAGKPYLWRRLLIDTNVLIYLYEFKLPDKQARSREVLDELGTTGNARLSVESLSEFSSIVTRKLAPPLSPEDAIKQVESFTRLWPVFDLTPLTVLEAGRGMRDHQLSFHDAQIWASARLNQVRVVFSEDFSDGSTLGGSGL